MLSSHFNMTTSECLLFGRFRCHVWNKSKTKIKEAWSRVTNSKLQSVTKPSTTIHTCQVRTCWGNFCYFWVQLVILHQPIRSIYFKSNSSSVVTLNYSLWQLESSRHFLKENTAATHHLHLQSTSCSRSSLDGLLKNRSQAVRPSCASFSWYSVRHELPDVEGMGKKTIVTR